MKKYSIGLAAFMMLGACGKERSGSATVNSNWLAVGGTLGLQNSFNRLMGGILNPLPNEQVFRPLANASIGQALVANISNLEYYFTSIQICESATLNGSGYSNPTGCITIYTKDTGSSEYNDYLLAEGDAETGESTYINVVDQTSLAKLNKTISVTPGTYTIGLVNFMRPFRVKASIPVGSDFYTTQKTASTISGFCDYTGPSVAGPEVCSNPLDYFEKRTVTNMIAANGTEELASYMLTNGGTLFNFSSPITVADGDELSFDLAINPEHIFKTGLSSTTELQGNAYSGAGGTQSMQMPFIDIAPVMRKTSEKSFRARYLSAAVQTGEAAREYQVQVDVYFAGASASDIATAPIQSVSLRSISTDGATKAFVFTGSVASSIEAATTAGEINILNYNGDTVIGGLKLLSTTSDTDQASIDETKLLGSQYTDAVETYTFTLQSVNELE